jgi:hypothetical protein
MKYLCLFETNYEDIERSMPLWKQIMDERAQGSDRWPKQDQIVLEPHFLESELTERRRDIQSIFIYETENPIHVVNYRMHWAKIFDLKRVVPITPARLTFETWQLMK